MAKKKEQVATVFMLGCNDAVDILNGTATGSELTGIVLSSTLKESLSDIEEGHVVLSDGSDGEEAIEQAIYEVTIKKVGNPIKKVVLK